MNRILSVVLGVWFGWVYCNCERRLAIVKSHRQECTQPSAAEPNRESVSEGKMESRKE